MFRLLLVLFIVIPLVEIALFIEVGGIIGVAPTIILIIVTAILGAGLLRLQGLMTIRRVQENIDHGQLPAIELIEGAMLLISGAFLLTPGFFTDALGFLVLVPTIRRRIALWLLSRVSVIQAGGSVHHGGPDMHRRRDGHYTIEGDYKRED